MRYFSNPLPEYETRGVAEHVDPFIVLLCVKMLAELIDSGIEPDYLQVYRISHNAQTNILTIRHSQEVPKYEKVSTTELPADVKPFDGKLFYIDNDGEYKIIMLAEEY